MERTGVPTPSRSAPTPKAPWSSIYLTTHELGPRSGDSGLLQLAIAVFGELLYDLIVPGFL